MPSTIEEIATTGFSMIQYLERFGGYGQYKELGLIQYAIRTSMGPETTWPF